MVYKVKKTVTNFTLNILFSLKYLPIYDLDDYYIFILRSNDLYLLSNILIIFRMLIIYKDKIII